MQISQTTLIGSAKRKTSLTVLSALVLGALVNLPASAQTISTLSGWNGLSGTATWGAGIGTLPTYGQSITALAGYNTLDSFTFKLAPRGPGTLTNTNYQAYIYNWDTTNKVITGSELWSSGSQNTGSVSASFRDYTFNPGIAVTSGNSYMLFLSTLGETNIGTARRGTWATRSDNPYSDGGFFFSNQTSLVGLSAFAWTTPVSTADSAFSASFSNSAPSSVTPELPGTALLAAAFLPVAFGAFKQRRRKAA